MTGNPRSGNKPNLAMRQRIAELRAQGLRTDVIACLVKLSVQSVLGYERRPGVIKRKRGKPECPEIAARNSAIYEACQRGYSYARVAELYKITKGHARMIKLREAEKRQQSQTTLSAPA